MNVPPIGSNLPSREPEPPESAPIGEQRDGEGYDFEHYFNEAPQSTSETNETGPDHSDWPESSAVTTSGTSEGSAAIMQTFTSAMEQFMVTFGNQQNMRFMNNMNEIRQDQDS